MRGKGAATTNPDGAYARSPFRNRIVRETFSYLYVPTIPLGTKGCSTVHPLHGLQRLVESPHGAQAFNIPLLKSVL